MFKGLSRVGREMKGSRKMIFLKVLSYRHLNALIFVKLPTQSKTGSWFYFHLVTTTRTPTGFSQKRTVLLFLNCACFSDWYHFSDIWSFSVMLITIVKNRIVLCSKFQNWFPIYSQDIAKHLFNFYLE